MTDKKTTIETFIEKTLTANTDQTVDVLIRITPPEMEQTGSKRPKLNLSMVLDRSGSMNGRKIEEAKEAAKYCIDQLLATDRISAVIFDDHIDVLLDELARERGQQPALTVRPAVIDRDVASRDVPALEKGLSESFSKRLGRAERKYADMG